LHKYSRQRGVVIIADIKAALEKFRNHWIYDDVNIQREMEQSARKEILNLMKLPDDEFQKQMFPYLRGLPLMRSGVLEPIFEGNSIERIKVALTILFNDEKSENDRLAAMWKLAGVGKIYASWFLALATWGDFIIFDHALIAAMKEIEPKQLNEDFVEVYTRKDLLTFMKACRKVYKKYGFTSFAELRVFLGNGYVTDWTFENL
jgi:hypothetical protein